MKLWPFTEKRSIQNPAVPLTAANILDVIGANARSTSGIAVNEDKALTIAAVYACVRVLSETIASLPLNVFRRTADGKEPATDDPRHQLLHAAPSTLLTSYYLFETLVAHASLWGNGYALIIRFKGSRLPAEIIPLLPWAVTVERQQDRTVEYKVRFDDGRTEMHPQENIIHIPMLGTDGLMGISPIGKLRNALGLALATEEFGARFFANDARPGIVIEVPGNPSAEAMNRIKNEVEEKHRGLGKSHSAMVAPAGMKIQEVGVPPEDAQFLETRKFQINEIARIYRVPPHLIGDLERATFSNIEQQDIGLAKHTIRPWAVRIEQELNRKMFNPKENLFAEFNLDGLQRGDFKSRTEGYASAITNGWMTRNEVRKKENLPPIDGLDEPLTPLNMAPQDPDANEVNQHET